MVRLPGGRQEFYIILLSNRLEDMLPKVKLGIKKAHMKLTHAVKTEAHVVKSNVVFPNTSSRVFIIFQRFLILSYSIIKSPCSMCL